MAVRTARRLDLTLPAGPAHVARVVATTSGAGDFSPGADGLARRQASIVEGPWTWLRQVHGRDVVVVDSPGDHAGESADAAVTTRAGAVMSIRTADCVPLALVGDGAVGVVHAGWRGLVAGVVAAAIAAMEDLGVAPRSAVVGPHICAGCYEFGDGPLSEVVAVAGPEVAAVSRRGRPALDLAAATRSVLAQAGVRDTVAVADCTACAPGYWSHRARGDRPRQVTVAWMVPR